MHIAGPAAKVVSAQLCCWLEFGRLGSYSCWDSVTERIVHLPVDGC